MFRKKVLKRRLQPSSPPLLVPTPGSNRTGTSSTGSSADNSYDNSISHDVRTRIGNATKIKNLFKFKLKL